MQVFVFLQLVSSRHERSQRRERRHDMVSQLRRPAQPVARRARRRIAQPARRHNHPPALPLPSVSQFDAKRSFVGSPPRKPCHPRHRKREGPIVRWEGSGAAGRFQGGAAARLLRQTGNFRFGFDFDAEREAGVDERIDDVGSVVGGREGAVAALDDGRHAERLEPVHDGLGRQIIEGGLNEIRLRANVPGEGVPVLHIREIAAALAGNHHLAGRPRHLLQHRDLRRLPGVHEGPGGVVRRHQAGRAAADDDNVRLHDRIQKRESLAHRTATTSCPCCLPALGEFRGSWSCTTFPLQI